MNVSEYIPPHFTDDHLLKGWLNTYSAFDKNRSKWKLPLLARVICDFDIILTNRRADVAISKDSRPQEILTFEVYMDSARQVCHLSLWEKLRVRKCQIGKQKDWEHHVRSLLSE